MTLCRRKDLGQQAQEKLNPDSNKSGLDKASESVSSTGDKVAGSLQPGKLTFRFLPY